MLNGETHHVIPDDDNLQLPDLEAQNKLSRTSCSCLVASNQCLAGRGIATMAINKLPTFSCSVNTAAFIAAVLIPVCAMLVPMYLSDRIRDISTTGILGETLRSSTRLVITESISIGCTLPLLSDMFMSRITAPASRRAEVMTLSTRHRLICILTSSGASVLYISLSDCYFMAYLYIVMNRTKVLVVGAVTFYVVSEGRVAQNTLLSRGLLLVPVLLCGLGYSLQTYDLLFPGNAVLGGLAALVYYVSIFSYFLVQVPWYWILWRHYRTHKTLGSEEQKESLYMLVSFFYMATCVLVLTIFGWPTWPDRGAPILIGYIVVQILCVLLATVLPTMFMRKVVQMSEAILELKREFVRYVSHEIRSPLNVVHAGLELLRADLAAAGVLPSFVGLLQDIYFASNTAIEILNEMLQYEHIDSGTFRLDCAAVPMLQAFAGRMDSFKFMLSKKNIALHIEDLAQVSEFAAPTVPTADEVWMQQQQLLDEDGDSDLSLSLPPATARTSLSPDPKPNRSTGRASAAEPLVLFMDRFRVEQIIRNLITNAVKFTPEGGNVTIRFLACSEKEEGSREDAAVHLQYLPRQQHLEAMKPDSVAGFSAEALTVTQNFLRIEVVDSGIGIAAEDQLRLFRQFVQFNRNALQGGGGSGLGLWICKNLASFHGGRMGFHSDGVGTGSTFFVDLPIFSAKDPAMLSEPTLAALSFSEQQLMWPAPLIGPAPGLGPASHSLSCLSSEVEGLQGAVARTTRILIVDDSSMNRKIIRRMVEASSNAAALGQVCVEEADDGNSAVEAIQLAAQGDSGPGFDLVLIDYVMVAMNGPEAVQIMRGDHQFAGGIIGVTGNALPSDLTFFQQCGADTVITKPLTNKKLMDAIQLVRERYVSMA